MLAIACARDLLRRPQAQDTNQKQTGYVDVAGGCHSPQSPLVYVNVPTPLARTGARRPSRRQEDLPPRSGPPSGERQPDGAPTEPRRTEGSAHPSDSRRGRPRSSLNGVCRSFNYSVPRDRKPLICRGTSAAPAFRSFSVGRCGLR